MTPDQQRVVDAWNEMATQHDLPTVRLMPPARLRKLAARLAEAGVDGMLEAIRQVGQSNFCCGQNGRGWKADLDFLLQPSSLVRALEGRYANPDTSNVPFRNGAMAILAETTNRLPVIDVAPGNVLEGPVGD